MGALLVTDIRVEHIAVSSRTTWLMVAVDVDCGFTGWGEFSDGGHYAPEAPLIRSVLGASVGCDLLADFADIQRRLWELCDEAVGQDDVWIVRTLVGAIISAAGDVLSQEAGVPLWQWLGGRDRESVPLYANINRAITRRRPDDFARVADAAVADGFTSIKLAPFDGPPRPDVSVLDDGIASVAAVRNAIGDDAAIYVDLHQRLSRVQLTRALPSLEGLGVSWLEDAVDASDLDALGWLSNATTMPLAGGELVIDADVFVKIANTRLLSFMLLDPKYIGGLFRTRDIMEQLPPVAITFHNPTGPVSTAMCASLSALTESVVVIEYPYGEPVDRAAMTAGTERIQGGNLLLSDRPGLGIDFRRL